MTRTLYILGGGYTGDVLARQLEERGDRVVTTHRRIGSAIQPGNGIDLLRFELSDRATWNALPLLDGAVWTFPAEPLSLVEEFSSVLFRATKRVIAIGTTSSFLVNDDDHLVDEDAPLDHSRERVRGEEYLRSMGAVVLRSAGIYGPGRNPIDWLRSGRIDSPGKFVNLIHVEDLSSSICAALDSPVRGEQFIVSDGKPRQWIELEQWARRRNLVSQVTYSGKPLFNSKRVSNAKLLAHLTPRLTHTDLFKELEILETWTKSTTRDEGSGY